MTEKYPKLSLRGIKMLRMYECGQTLEQIGSNYGISRERVRQIIHKAAILELAGLYGMDLKDKSIYMSLSLQADFLFHQIKTARKETKLESELEEINKAIENATIKNIRPENFYSLSMYSKYTGIKENELKKHHPDIVEIILNNKRKRWSWHYPQCRSCGTISVKHHSLGYCESCYFKSTEFKEMIKDSNQRNFGKRATHYKKYSQEYSKRPEVKKRILNIAFDGNREKAIERDESRCVKCGITREKSQEKYGKDFFVKRIDNNKDNNQLDNLKTLCMGCFQKISKSN